MSEAGQGAGRRACRSRCFWAFKTGHGLSLEGPPPRCFREAVCGCVLLRDTDAVKYGAYALNDFEREKAVSAASRFERLAQRCEYSCRVVLS